MKKEPIGKLISYIHRQNQKRLAKQLAPYGIGSGGQHSFLKVVLHNPGITQDQLTQQLKFDKATTARSIKQLEQSGYIERKPDPDDRRSQLLYPTLKAQEFYPMLQSILDDHNKKLTCHISSEEEDLLISLLHKISVESPEQPED
ncbi:MarR family winged helix-turn-helix transcriptional regulator [Paenibacillus pini]|uniref:Transcriptional regulator n=1 Tax=Paenibacillus pini JCM 16418 TaxID=1236976 RepID=W7YFT8_9BACL|nr:MarR family winged helix-turn-helix transcriptional regulator [Paenibacillus pini]GAF06393.1 transcriptional regulator [Paenibacillus pini JCM 16418]